MNRKRKTYKTEGEKVTGTLKALQAAYIEKIKTYTFQDPEESIIDST